MRGDFAREWAAFAETEADYAWNLLSSPGVVAQLGAVRERLSGGGGRKAGAAGGSASRSRL